MKCTACGVEVTAGSAYCHKCGERMDEDTTADKPGKADQAKEPAPPEQLTPAERLRSATNAAGVADDPEDEMWEGRYSAKAMIGNWILGIVVLVGALIAGIVVGTKIVWIIALAVAGVFWLWLLWLLFYRRFSVKYELTSQRFIHKSGILSVTTDRIEAIDMDDVSFKQNVVERMVGVGTITIMSSDTSHPQLVLRGIEDVKRIADLFDDIRRKERRRRGLHIEAV